MKQETSPRVLPRVLPYTVRLSPTPRGARLARLLATEQLRSWGLPVDPGAVVVAELAANAVTHGRVAGRDFRLTLYAAGDVLRIEVTDTRGDRLPRRGPGGPDADGGRGLLLVDALALRWGTAAGPAPLKTVWAELRTGRGGTPAADPPGAGLGAGFEGDLGDGLGRLGEFGAIGGCGRGEAELVF
ncbi:ATP-binding protein [Streptomyces sp. NPDC017082]|uniref:ATP-binding protein n=1 Tax=Streptomyces sp. NPDC017082 TaxID=3364974 RepID=UPI0037AF218A